MLSVTFQEPILISAENIHSLLSLAGAPALVVPYVEHAVTVAAPAKRTRKSAASSDAAPAAGVKKRVRRTKAQIEADNLAAAGGAPAADPVPEPDPANDIAPIDTAPAADAAPAADPAPAKAPAKKRDRRSPAKKAADAAAEAAAKSAPSGKGKSTEKAKSMVPASSDAPTTDAAALSVRFAALIDKDFDAAKGLLDEAGVKRFGELTAAQLPVIAAKLTELKF